LFELICHRYEWKSLLFTSPQPFQDWDDIFLSGYKSVAAADRLFHHFRFIGIKAGQLPS
jgi:DNA replication protein DnaC